MAFALWQLVAGTRRDKYSTAFILLTFYFLFIVVHNNGLL